MTDTDPAGLSGASFTVGTAACAPLHGVIDVSDVAAIGTTAKVATDFSGVAKVPDLLPGAYKAKEGALF